MYMNDDWLWGEAQEPLHCGYKGMVSQHPGNFSAEDAPAPSLANIFVA